MKDEREEKLRKEEVERRCEERKRIRAEIEMMRIARYGVPKAPLPPTLRYLDLNTVILVR